MCNSISKQISSATNSPTLKKILLGTTSGFITGYCGTRFGKMIALAVGGSLIVFLVALRKKGDVLDLDAMDEKAKEAVGVMKEHLRQNNTNFSKMKSFVKRESFLVGGFCAASFVVEKSSFESNFLEMDVLNKIISLPLKMVATAGVALVLYVLMVRQRQQRRMCWLRNKTVLITGASSGLGEALARQFYLQGCKLILAARSLSKLNKNCEMLVQQESLAVKNQIRLHEPQCYAVDLANPNSIESFVEEVVERNPVIDVIVNNAGISVRSCALDTTMQVHRLLMEVNYFGHIAVTQAILNRDVKSKSVVCISSVQGRIAIPHRSAYAASKHAFQGYFDCLRAEMAHLGLQVLLVSPGYIRTQLSANALDGTGVAHNVIDRNTETGMLPDWVACRILKALVNNEQELILASWYVRFAILLRVIWPSLYFWIMQRRASRTE
ncbi:Dehydrogenase/reductase SDR family protein 7-like [Trichinella pseudospiralis]|uniref:Dehydrogenase/reductase SDR family protein 7-like n=2 Tax=Trichinella pseudospiralis TaxID=6337 RepID=A0A0V1IC23_TRIPS|nr:Dehydrogenase/reductase SDR family protein 7-like [Trichinella pseudospiralis]KRX87806.1 Dehydrogenase/reductase SDR family protein 7-like [Trichinella pseudospiralis]KRY82597.1 Dehydrogenase/reductase SDR family protein 7-like [Trichinella pseudospiralis]KRZ20414.1 Dehydrogenase/reductase SDR family protein 7-like [Trichinella pseudospiralis]KRZ40897.1 Dehydrogenase/reductase SDR family protein 7-like [Trichinella pseudospiralis]